MASKQYQVVLTMNAKQLENYLGSLKRRAKEVADEMERMKLTNDGDDKKYAQLRKEFDMLQDTIKRGTSEMKDYTKVINDLGGSKLYELRRALRQVRNEMEKVSYNDPRFAKLQETYKAIDDQIKKMTGSYKKQGNVIAQVAKRLSAYVLIYSGFNVVKNKLAEVVTMNLELSDSLADIRKTTGLANEEVSALADNLLKLDTRTTAAELNQLAYQAGRMGVGKFGMEGVAGFVRAANEIKIALGEDLGEGSVEEIYKLADVMGVIPQLGIEGSLLSIGSAINELVQTGTSSGEFIVDFTSRMAGIAAQANLSTAEVAAFGSALDEMGQEVEVSATSMNKFVMQMFTHYKLVAKAADMSEESLKTMLENGQTADAIVAVMEGLSEKGGLSMLAPLFKDLGSDGARLSQTLAAMSSNVDKLKSSLGVARAAFGEARSVTNEYNIKNETTAALLERIKNSWVELFVNTKNKGAVHELVTDLQEMSASLMESDAVMVSLESTMSLLVLAVKGLIALIPGILTFLALRTGFEMLRLSLAGLKTVGGGLVATFDLLRVSIMKLGGAEAACSAKTLRFAASFKTLSTGMKANIFIAVASAILAIVQALREVHKESDKSAEDMKRLNDSYKSYSKNLLEEQTRVDGLFAVLKNEASTKKERAEAIHILNTEYGEYLPNMLTEETQLDDIKKAQDRLNESMIKGIALRSKQNAMREVLDPIYEDLAETMGDYSSGYKANKRLQGYDPAVMAAAVREMAAAGKSKSDIFNDVMFNAEMASGYAENPNLSWRNRDTESYNGAKAILEPVIDEFLRLQEMIDKINAMYDPIIGDQTVIPKKTKIVENDEEEKKKAGRQARQDANRDYDALVADIKAFFELQKAAATSKFNQRIISEEDMDAFHREYEKMMHETLLSAREAIYSGNDADWKQTKTDLGNRIHLDNGPKARGIMSDIRKADTGKMHESLSKFGEGELDDIRKKSADDAAKIEKVSADFQKEVNKMLLKQDYLAKTANDFQRRFEKFGLLNISRTDNLDEIGGAVSLSTKDMEQKWTAAIDNIRKNYEQLFYIDIDTSEGQQAFRDLISPLRNDFPQVMKMTEEQLRLFYQTVMEFHDADDEARKRAERDEEKLMRYRFSKTYFSEANTKAQKENKHEQGWTKIMGEVGLSTDALMADQEVELYKLKLEAAQNYYEYVMTHAEEKANQDRAQQELDQATMEMTEKLVAKVGEHLAYLKEYGDAIADFGTDFGEAIFGSLEDRQKTIENLAKAFGQTTKKIILDWVKQRMMHKLHTKLMKKETQKFQKEKNQEEEKGAKISENITKVTEDTKEDMVQKAGAEITKTKKEQTSENISNEAKETQATGAMGVAQGAAKTIGKLGWWGIPLVAVIEALLNGLLSMAMSKVSSLFGGSGAEAGPVKPTKIVSGMLTYDGGNVQELTRYMGDDGILYTVSRELPELQTGMVTQPVATRINGAPALVGERGPEMVIGRETTAAMMMARPDLVRAIAEFDRNHSGRGFRAYDAGNVSEVAAGLAPGASSEALLVALQELSAVNAALTAQLRQGIHASINKYGRGGLAEEVVDALQFEARNGNNPQIRRMFSR